MLKNFFYKWVDNNIYNNRIWDASFYFFLFLAFPIFITMFSIIPKENLKDVLYAYIGVFVNGANSIYDITNRWKSEKCFFNLKLLITLIPIIIVLLYSLGTILYIVITGSFSSNIDGILYIYFVTVFITFTDIIACFTAKATLKD